MRGFALAIAVLLVCVSSPADSIRLEGEPFHPSTNTGVTWNAPTNDLPSELWIYKVMPEAVSAGVVSNAMKLGQFTMKDLSKSAHPIIRDKDLIYFYSKGDSGKSRHLFIAPSLGIIEFAAERDYNKPIENVPNAVEVEKLARGVLCQLGVDKSLICNPKPGYDETSTRYKYDKGTHKMILPGVTETVVRGIAFQRRIDGVLESGSWCFMIHFRSHGEIEDFSLYWRNILPQESHPTVSPAQIIGMIKDGQTQLPPQFDDVSGITAAKNLVVTKITPRYFNGTGKEPLDFLKPYADLEVSADFGTNTSTFYLKCPILSANVAF
jgi:hypothetical protein